MRGLRGLLLLMLVVLAATTVTGCAAIEGIFKAGVWTGVILVVIAVVVIGGIAAMVRS